MSDELKASKLTALYARLQGAGRQVGVPQFVSLQQLTSIPAKSVWAYAAVYRIARTLAECRWRLVERGTQREAKTPAARQVQTVLQHINDDKTYRELATGTFVDLQIQGELATELARHPIEKNVTELYHINPKYLDPVAGTSQLISHYIATVDGASRRLEVRDVARAINYNSDSELRGLSPLLSIRRALSTDLNAEVYNDSLVKKGGRSGGMLIPREGEYFGEEEFDSIVEHVKEQIFGVINAGELFIVPPGFEFVEAGQTLRDMDWLELRKYTREMAAAAFGASPMQVNNFESATYANSREQRSAFWDDTGRPHLGLWFGALNERWIQKEEDVALELVPDLQYIQALIDDKQTRSTVAMAEYREGVRTKNEAREVIGLPRVKDGDVFRVSMNEILIDLQGNVIDPLGLTKDDPAPAPAPAVPPPKAAAPRELIEPEMVAIVKRAHLRDLRIAERMLIGVTARILTQQLESVVAAVRNAGDVSTLTQEDVFNVDVAKVQTFQALTPEVLRVIDRGGEAALRRLGAERRGVGRWEGKADAPFTDVELQISFAIDNPRVLDYVRTKLFAHISDLTEKTGFDLRELFEEAIGSGEGTSDILRRLHEAGTFSEGRAERIARTETAAAYNTGSHTGFEEAGVQRKSWLDAGFGKIRESHREVSQRTQKDPIPITEDFVLIDPDRGESRLPYPAAPEGPAHECVNCRCTELPEDDAGTETRNFYVEECKQELIA
jgi:HK97 family phage portal protein